MSNQELLRSKLQIHQVALEQSQAQLNQTEAKLHQVQLELQQAQDEIAAMKTSKFWRLRSLWFKLKESARLVSPARPLVAPEAVHASTQAPQSPLPEIAPAIQVSNYKQLFSDLYSSVLESFLSSDAKLVLNTSKTPLVTIVLVLFNRAELTLQCLRSLSEHSSVSFEVIIVDNASSDATHQLLDRVEGATLIYNSENLNFLLASNQAAKAASGQYLLFLNNDAQVLPGSIESALSTIESAENIGAVGGKIILLDGTLQEAGSIIWSDGSCLGYGRGDSPFASKYMFKREVDYCSGAFLLTRLELFMQVGGFDTDYVPAYYEETDYCVKLWRMGKRILYDPNAVILHFEFASSVSSDRAIQLQSEHRKIFLKKHGEYLHAHHLPPASNLLLARAQNRARQRILFIDDRVPHAYLGSGYPRARDILLSLLELDCFVTFYPLNFPAASERWSEIYQDIPDTVEVVKNNGFGDLQEFLYEREGYYDLIIVSRPHNIKQLNTILERVPELLGETKLIYDAEAIFALREIAQRQLNGELVSTSDMEALIADEVGLAKTATVVISVSKLECQNFSQCGIETVYTLGHALPISPTQASFEARSGILFVGAIYDDTSPNADSVIWFVEEILPELCDRLQTDVTLLVVGPNKSERITKFGNHHIQVLGKVDDLTDYYNTSRIFVAPTRFAAGIPRKVHEAAAYGLPVVSTTLIASQLGWKDGVDILVGDEPSKFAEQCARLYTEQALWQSVRLQALDRIQQDCSKATFTSQLKKILQKA